MLQELDQIAQKVARISDELVKLREENHQLKQDVGMAQLENEDLKDKIRSATQSVQAILARLPQLPAEQPERSL